MGKIKMRKNGIFFTFIAIIIMALFILIYTPPSDINIQKDMQAIGNRIGNLDNYMSDLKNRYFETVLRATTYKTILSLEYYINSTGSKISNFDSAFYEVSLNGTINSTPIDIITGKKIMENSTITNWSKKIIDASRDTYNVNTTITLSNVSVTQTGPWNLVAKLVISVDVKSNVAEWDDENFTVATNLGIEGFDDPLYIINTGRASTNKIKIRKSIHASGGMKNNRSLWGCGRDKESQRGLL